MQEDFLGSFRIAFVLAILGLSAGTLSAQNTPNAALDTNESLFTVLTAINTCGYDADLNSSDALRGQIRAEVGKATESSDEAKQVTQSMCEFYQAHQQSDPARNLAQYVSLALYLNPPPGLALKGKEADLPPDAAYISGFVPIAQKFYEVAGLQGIWQRHQPAYALLTQRYHPALSKMLFDTEIYLKLPSAGYLGRNFTVYLDPMGDPGQTNARNYGSDYFVVLSPGTGTVRMEQVRHTYLHYLLDPLALKYPANMERLKPLLAGLKSAPLDESFKGDASLLVTECFIRAIEARTLTWAKIPEAEREQVVQRDAEQGYVLTPYFYEALAQFEKTAFGLRQSYGDIINGIDLRKEQKRMSEIKFASKADPELLHFSQPDQGKLLLTAEQRLSSGDKVTAQKLAQQALDEKKEDPGRALFILAQVATMNRDMQGARNYFEKALGVAREPTVLAWSHIYLGRIFDLQENRPAALEHYRAALSSGAALPEAKAAAERGIQQPYEPPTHPQPQEN